MSKLLTIWNYIRRHKYMITVLIFIVAVSYTHLTLPTKA